MIGIRTLLPALLILPLGSGCDEGSPTAELPPETASAEQPWTYERSYTFATERQGQPLAAPFAFQARPRADRHERSARGWLARGPVWDPFLDERWSAAAVGGPWRVLPHGALRLAVGGAAGIERLWFESGERRLRLEIGSPRTGWQGGERERFRVLSGTLVLGAEAIEGPVLEEMRVLRQPARGAPSFARDRLILVDGSGFLLYLLHEHPAGPTGTQGRSWVLAAGMEEARQEGSVSWPEVRPLEAARRDIPLRWAFEAAEADVRGEVSSIAYSSSVGEERAGRRAVEIRYTVEGWLEMDGERREVRGVVRHEQG